MAALGKHSLRLTTRGIVGRFLTLVREPIFILATAIVHGSVLLAATAFFGLEKAVNQQLRGPLDAVYWAVTTMMTVGYGDIVPVTAAGKVLAMIVIAIGSVASVGYTALFVGILVMPELRRVEHRMEKQVHDEEAKIERLTERLADATGEFQRRIGAKDPAANGGRS